MNKSYLNLVKFEKYIRGIISSEELKTHDIEKTVNKAASMMYLIGGLFQKLLKNSPNTLVLVKLKHEKVQVHVDRIYNDLTTNMNLQDEQIENLNKYKSYFDNCLELG
jgi:hypothetical protein